MKALIEADGQYKRAYAAYLFFLLFLFLLAGAFQANSQKIFDVHVHGAKDAGSQLSILSGAGVYKAALSTSWALQNTYEEEPGMQLLFGLMLPCPNGKVPYSMQPCFSDGKDWPGLQWVEKQIITEKIDFIGEVLSQYYGISPSDTLLYPYYALAEKYGLPVGIHTGLAGPGHGSPAFRASLGSPLLLEEMLIAFPDLKVWAMHAGAPFIEDTIAVMSVYRNVYTDISAISNPDLMGAADFYATMKRLVDAGLEDRLMFGSDNGDIDKAKAAVTALDFLTAEQKEKIFYRNAERFFSGTGE